jgi:hypothetical protein
LASLLLYYLIKAIKEESKMKIIKADTEEDLILGLLEIFEDLGIEVDAEEIEQDEMALTYQ